MTFKMKLCTDKRLLAMRRKNVVTAVIVGLAFLFIFLLILPSISQRDKDYNLIKRLNEEFGGKMEEVSLELPHMQNLATILFIN